MTIGLPEAGPETGFEHTRFIQAVPLEKLIKVWGPQDRKWEVVTLGRPAASAHPEEESGVEVTPWRSASIEARDLGVHTLRDLIP